MIILNTVIKSNIVRTMSLDHREAKRRSANVSQGLMERMCMPQPTVSFGQTTARPIAKNPSWMDKPTEISVPKPKICKFPM